VNKKAAYPTFQAG